MSWCLQTHGQKGQLWHTLISEFCAQRQADPEILVDNHQNEIRLQSIIKFAGLDLCPYGRLFQSTMMSTRHIHLLSNLLSGFNSV